MGGMSETQVVEALPTKKEVPLVEDHRVVEWFMVDGKPLAKVDEVEVRYLLGSCESWVGSEFRGDPNLAVMYTQDFLDGARLPMLTQMSPEEVDEVHFGVDISDKFAGQYNRWALNFDRGVELKLISLGYYNLEDASRHEPSENYEHRVGADSQLYTSGPTWYFIRQIGVEEGAHAAYLARHPGVGGVRLIPGSSVIQYLSNNAEYDGLLWRMIDTQLLLESPDVSEADKALIQKNYELYVYQKHKVDEFRRKRHRNTTDVDVMREKYFQRKPF